jgi:hypothetical protein
LKLIATLKISYGSSIKPRNGNTFFGSPQNGMGHSPFETVLERNQEIALMVFKRNDFR